MKILLNLVLSAFILVSMAHTVNAQQSQEHNHHSAHQSAQGNKYACLMHPEVTGKQGDICPKCGMNLTKVEAMTKHHGKRCDSCPDHKEQGHDQHMDKNAKSEACPMSKMHVDNKHAQPMNHGATADTHACPMNPSITGKQGETCHKCGMNLEPMQAKSKSSGHHKH